MSKTLCAHEGCPRRAINVKKGGEYCGLHQHRIDNDLPMDGPLRKECAVEGCPRKVKDVRKGGEYCVTHQRRIDKGLPLDDLIRTGINGTIYVLTCKVNYKRRVGLTITPLEERLRHYELDAWKDENKDHPLYIDIRRYGIDAFDIRPIMVGIDTIPALNISEKAFIQILDTIYPRGYNMDSGGGYGLKQRNTCKVDGCDGKHKGHGYCEKHYMAYRKYGDPLGKAEPRQPRPACAVDGCDIERLTISQYCRNHERNWKKHGDPLGKFGGKLMCETECSVEGCNELASSRGWCVSHYMDWYKNGYIDPTKQYKRKAKCLVDGCLRPARAEGLCGGCYQRKYRTK